ncbi:hypothetical protein BDY24DRAFT_417931 [Mrakia frigida]|uniref:uncharacterized protein n=1 Tax=Mrakia frigida TaxID=29902 RepID=UPI003FCC2389
MSLPSSIASTVCLLISSFGDPLGVLVTSLSQTEFFSKWSGHGLVKYDLFDVVKGIGITSETIQTIL